MDIASEIPSDKDSDHISRIYQNKESSDSNDHFMQSKLSEISVPPTPLTHSTGEQDLGTNPSYLDQADLKLQEPIVYENVIIE